MNNKQKIERLENLKLARRRKYANIKQDPVLYEAEREKEKLRYIERKKKKQIKSIHEESPRIQREKRKKWREASRKYKQKQKELVSPEVLYLNTADSIKDEIEANAEDALYISPPKRKIFPDSNIERNKKIKSVHEGSPRTEREKRKIRREASKIYQQEQTEYLKEEPEIPEVVLVTTADSIEDEIEAGTEDALYISIPEVKDPDLNKKKKQIKSVHEESSRNQKDRRETWREASRKYRQKQKEIIKKEPKPKISPDSKIRRIRYLEYKKRKHLINVINQLKETNKELLRKLQDKEKDEKSNNKELDKKTKINEDKKEEKNKKDIRIESLIKKVRAFYEEDANSAVEAGKKQYITKNQILKHLHKQFMAKYQEKISFTFFCKHRPFWVLKLNSSQRDTCLCILHENINLKIQALNRAGIINEANSDVLMSKLCCSIYNQSCLKRECQTCRHKTVNMNEFTNDQDLVYFEWVRGKERIRTKENEKVITLTKEEKIIAKPQEVVNALLASLPDFFEHSYKIYNQYTVMKQLKDSLNINCAVIHADFFENYELKFHKKNMHFSGSQQAVCLHTAIIHSFDYAISSVNTTSVSTASSCLRRDPPAVWAHMISLIQKVIKDNPFIDTLHFETDSSVSQYKNNMIFYVISQFYKDFPQITSISWNYAEAGHGKGAPGDVGATIKRTVDSYVNYGKDVDSYDKFIQVVQENIDNVTMIDVLEKTIIEIENKIPDNLPTFTATLAVHQVLWKSGVAHLTFRSASCFECGCEKVCSHGKHLGFLTFPSSDLMSPPAACKARVIPLICIKKPVVLKKIGCIRFSGKN